MTRTSLVWREGPRALPAPGAEAYEDNISGMTTYKRGCAACIICTARLTMPMPRHARSPDGCRVRFALYNPTLHHHTGHVVAAAAACTPDAAPKLAPPPLTVLQ